MTEVPTTAWAADFDEATALAEAPRFGASRKHVAWRKLAGVVRHAFTHFPLELSVYRAELPRDTAAPAGTRWIAIRQLGAEALPSLKRKVVAHGLER